MGYTGREILGAYNIVWEPLPPGVGLALEELILHRLNEHLRRFLLVWRSTSSIVIGRRLSLCEEVNCSNACIHNIPICRRLSGGGAVYHDPGNLNISLLAYTGHRYPVDKVYEYGLGIIRRLLSILGYDSHIENQNDIVIGKYKVSGSSALILKDRYLFHATLLIEADTSLLDQVIVPRLDRVARGEVTPAKYNPWNLSSIGPMIRLHNVLHVLKQEIVKDMVNHRELVMMLLPYAYSRALDYCMEPCGRASTESPVNV
ncbi:MAG: hypothetical protein GSR81_07125 [Desulfurococcales archaeon]|nr:hypothetical protein [Desulfurococcales archaeon]